jgi:hypothetical protein
MYFNDFSRGYEISFRIIQGSGYYHGSGVDVSGSDTLWVNGVMRQFEESIQGWERQPSWPQRYSLPMTILFALSVGRIYIFLLDIFFDYVIPIQPISPRPAWADILIPIAPWIDWGLALVVGIWPGIWLANKMKGLWPNVEIQTGPEYAQVHKRRRQRIWLIMTVGVLPLLLYALYDLMRFLINR